MFVLILFIFMNDAATNYKIIDKNTRCDARRMVNFDATDLDDCASQVENAEDCSNLLWYSERTGSCHCAHFGQICVDTLETGTNRYLIQSKNPECRHGWTKYKEKCFRSFPARLNWRDAESKCQGYSEGPDRGDLVQIDSLDENRAVTDILRNSKPFWIGLHNGLTNLLGDHPEHKRWLWSSGDGLRYKRWDLRNSYPKHVPNNPNPDEYEASCANISPSGYWRDGKCWDVKCGFVCQYILPSIYNTVTLCSNLDEIECNIEATCAWNSWDMVCASRSDGSKCHGLAVDPCVEDQHCHYDIYHDKCERVPYLSGKHKKHANPRKLLLSKKHK